MIIAKLYHKSTDTTGARVESHWISRNIAQHESSLGECIRLAAFNLQHEDFDTWEEKMAFVLYGTKEYLDDCDVKLQTKQYKVLRGELVKIKEK